MNPPGTSSYTNSRASRARRVDLFEPRRDIVGMEQKSVEADPQSMKKKSRKLKNTFQTSQKLKGISISLIKNCVSVITFEKRLKKKTVLKRVSTLFD